MFWKLHDFQVFHISDLSHFMLTVYASRIGMPGCLKDCGDSSYLTLKDAASYSCAGRQICSWASGWTHKPKRQQWWQSHHTFCGTKSSSSNVILHVALDSTCASLYPWCEVMDSQISQQLLQAFEDPSLPPESDLPWTKMISNLIGHTWAVHWLAMI